MPSSTLADYAGDVTPADAWQALSRDTRATLIDVRTDAEWSLIGVPRLDGIGRETLLVAWNRFPDGEPIPDFAARLAVELDRRGIGRDAPLYFICRSGNRSRKAAVAATAGGYAHCYNVEFGFEGRLGPDGHRGTAGSWKAEGLPWVQS